MDTILLLVQKMPMGIFAFLFLIGFFLLYFILYFYINKNLNQICIIVFNDKNRYKSPLELFDFIYISFIPTTFWKELLSLKNFFKFKKLYQKDFFMKMDEKNLKRLLNEFPFFFALQYSAFICGILFMCLITGSYYFEI